MMATNSDTPTAPMPTTDRRVFFGVAALLGIAKSLFTGLTAAAQGTGADAELIELCAKWRAATDRYILAVNQIGLIRDANQTAADRALKEEVEDAVEDLENHIFEIEATTLAGVKAKAGVLDYMAEAMNLTMTEEQAASLIADIMALENAA